LREFLEHSEYRLK